MELHSAASVICSSLLLCLESRGLLPPPHAVVSLLGCTSYALTSGNPLHSSASTTAAIRSLGIRNPTAPGSAISSSFSETSPRRPACSSTSKTSGACPPLWSSLTTTSDSVLLTRSPSDLRKCRRWFPGTELLCLLAFLLGAAWWRAVLQAVCQARMSGLEQPRGQGISGS